MLFYNFQIIKKNTLLTLARKCFFFLSVFLISISTFAIPKDSIKIVKKNPLKITGYINTNSNFFSSDASLSATGIFGYAMSTGITFSYKSFSLPFRFIFTNGRSSFEKPANVFSRIGASPKFKNLTLHIGHRYHNMSPYIMTGMPLLGIGTDLKIKAFIFSVYYGKISEDYSIKSQIKNLNNIVPFERRLLGFKTGVSKGNFLFELLATRSHEIVKNDTQRDSLLNHGITPGYNFVLGSNFRIKLFHILSLQFSGAASALTPDKSAPNFDDEAAKKALAKVEFIMPANTSSSYALAYDGRIGLDWSFFGIGLKYQKIEPFYHAWGLSYINPDIENYLLDIRINAFKSKINFFGSAGIENNNTKDFSSKRQNRFIGNASLQYAINNKNSLNLNFNNFTTSIKPVIIESLDSTCISSESSTYSFSYNTKFGSDKKGSSIMANSVYSQYNTFDEKGELITDYMNKTFTNQILYSKKITKKGTEIGAGLNYNILTLPIDLQMERMGITSRFQWKPSKSFTLSSMLQYSRNKTNKQKDGNILTLNLNSSYKIAKNTIISVNGNWINRNTKIVKSINNYSANASISQSFN